MDFSKAIIAFSGGKDSVAVSQYMIKQGFSLPHVAIISEELDYRKHIDYIKWYCDKYRQKLHLINMSNLGIEFLKKNPQFIFPDNSKIKGRWFNRFQQNGVKKFSEKNDITTVIYGRRIADGNSIKSKFYKRSNGIGQFFPLRDWSDEKTMDFIADIKLSPIYQNEWAKNRGTHTLNIAPAYSDQDTQNARNFISQFEPEKLELFDYLIQIKNGRKS